MWIRERFALKLKGKVYDRQLVPEGKGSCNIEIHDRALCKVDR